MAVVSCPLKEPFVKPGAPAGCWVMLSLQQASQC
jgi:hypothetical protein